MEKLFGKVNKEVLFYRFYLTLKRALGETAPAKLPILEYTLYQKYCHKKGYGEI